MDEWHVQVMESTTANVLSSIQSISDRVERLERECEGECESERLLAYKFGRGPGLRCVRSSHEERWAQVEAAKKRGLELGALLDSRRKTRSGLFLSAPKNDLSQLNC